MLLYLFLFLDTYKALSGLKKSNPNLKIMISLGSHLHYNQFSKIWLSSKIRRNFIRNSIKFLTSNNFDGLEVNWQQLANSGEAKKNKLFFTKFCEELSQSFKPFKLILSLALSGLTNVAENSYEINRIHK